MKLRKSKAQSAMEYLMTYGWAILIIAVVLGALFSLGVFKGTVGSHCIAVPPFTCQTPTMTTAGVVSVPIGVATESINVYAAACSSASSGTGYPLYGNIGVSPAGNNALSTVAPSLGGTPLPTTPSGPVVLNAGTIETLIVSCLSSNTALAATSYPIGSSFTGTIWLNYTTGTSSTPIVQPITSSFSVTAS